MDDLGVHHPAGHGLDPPDYASLLTTTQAAGEESISELHVVFCAAVAAACLLVPLLTAQALKLLRPMPAAPPPPPLATLSQDVQHAAAPSTQQQPSQQQQQQGDGGFGSPFTRSVLVYSTKTGASGGATPASPPMRTPASTAIPLLTEINQPSPAVASTSMWTVSKRDVLLRRGKQQAQQQQQEQGTAQAASADAGCNAAAAATLSHTGARGRGGFAKAAASSAAGAGAVVAHAVKAAVSSAQAGAQALLNSGCKAAGLLRPLWQRRPPQQQQQAGIGAANGHVYGHQDAGLPPAATGWPAELLTQSLAHEGAICSLEGLQASAEYQQWRGSQRVHVEEQVQQRLGAYQALRRVDPEAFSKLLSRPVVVDYDTLPPARLLLVTEYLLGLFITTATLALALAPSFPADAGLELLPFASSPPALRALPLLLWLLLQLGAWARGYSSCLGSLAGLYCVYEDARYSDHLRVASTVQILLAAVAEAVFLGAALLVPGTLYSIGRLCQGSSRAAFGQAAMRLQVVVERRRQVRISQYPPYSPSGLHLPGSFPLGQGAADATPVPQTSSLRQLGGMLAAAGATVGRSLASGGPGTGGAGSSGFGADHGGVSFSWGAMYSGSTAGRQSVDASGGRRGLASADKVEGRGAAGWLQGSATNTPGSLW